MQVVFDEEARKLSECFQKWHKGFPETAGKQQQNKALIILFRWCIEVEILYFGQPPPIW